MSNGDLVGATWFKSSYSNAQGDCVEVAVTDEAVAVRDSKNPHGPALVFTPGAFAAFIAEAADGEFGNL